MAAKRGADALVTLRYYEGTAVVQIIRGTGFNPESLRADDLYIQVLPPPSYLQGAPTDVCGIEGTASWGPVNKPVMISSPADLASVFGGISSAAITDPHDLPTDVSLAFNQVQNQSSMSVWASRVTDGTEEQSALTLEDALGADLITITAKYPGVLGDEIDIILSAGAMTDTVSVAVVPFVGAVAESYVNLPSAGAGVFAAALLDAINNGQGSLRPPSTLVDASAASLTAGAPVLGTFGLTGGADGRGVDNADLLGSDSAIPKTGIYALRGVDPPIGVMWIAGMTDSTVFSDLYNFILSEGMVGLFPFPANTESAAAIASKQGTGIDDPNTVWIKDWIYFFDAANGVTRKVPATAVIGGRLASLSPEQNPGNKPVYGVVGTERNDPFNGNRPYSIAEIGQLESAGIVFITNPVPGGKYFGMRHGQNGSSDPAMNTIEHARVTNHLVNSFSATMGKFVNQNQSTRENDATRAAVEGALNAFLGTLVNQETIDSFKVVCDLSNNTPDSIARHYLKADVAVRYMSSIRFFIISLRGGVTVVTAQNTATGS